MKDREPPPSYICIRPGERGGGAHAEGDVFSTTIEISDFDMWGSS